MIPHQFATIKVPRLLYACLCATLLCSFLGVVSDTRAQLTINQVCTALDMSTEDCSQILAVSFNPSNSMWRITTDTSVAGGASLRSPAIDDDQSSCLVLNLLLTPAQIDRFTITVAIRTSSEGQADQLNIVDNGSRRSDFIFSLSQILDSISADAGSTERDWSFETYYLPPRSGASIFFCYSKNSTNREGEDAAWIDSLSFSTPNISYKNRICDTLDLTDQNCAMIETLGTDRRYLWAVATDASVQGGSSLRSRGEFNDGRARTASAASDFTDNCFRIFLRQPLPGPTRIHYSRRINAEIDNVRLLLTTNGGLTRIDSFSAESNPLRDWEQGQFVVAGDVSSLTWCLVKDGTDAVGSDSVWIDALSFVTADLLPLCDTLDLPQTQCAMIRSATYEPPQNLWLTTTTAFIGGDSALVSPPLETGQSACLTLDIDSTLPSGSYLAFSWRITSPSDLDIFEFQAGGQQSQLRNMPQWQTEVGDLNGSESTLRWCYRFNSTADSQTARAWLDRILTVTPDDRYVVQIAVTGTPTTLAMTPPPTDSFRFQVTVTAQSPLLSTPTDWVLVASGINNISAADSTYALVFSDNSAQVDVTVTPDNSLLPSSVRLVLADRPLLRGVAITSLTVQLPAVQLLPSLNVDNADSGVTALDLIVALRWLTDQQQGNSEDLVANLAIDSSHITAAGINNLQQLFNENSNSVDLNKDGRADQLDLRILLRYMSGLRGAELAEQEVIEDIVRLLLGKPPNIP